MDGGGWITYAMPRQRFWCRLTDRGFPGSSAEADAVSWLTLVNDEKKGIVLTSWSFSGVHLTMVMGFSE